MKILMNKGKKKVFVKKVVVSNSFEFIICYNENIYEQDSSTQFN